jgi:hypothetical protein
MTSRRDIAISQPSEPATHLAEDLETAEILAQANSDCDAGLGLRGVEAKAFLQKVLDDAQARVAAAAIKPG